MTERNCKWHRRSLFIRTRAWSDFPWDGRSVSRSRLSLHLDLPAGLNSQPYPNRGIGSSVLRNRVLESVAMRLYCTVTLLTDRSTDRPNNEVNAWKMRYRTPDSTLTPRSKWRAGPTNGRGPTWRTGTGCCLYLGNFSRQNGRFPPRLHDRSECPL